MHNCILNGRRRLLITLISMLVSDFMISCEMDLVRENEYSLYCIKISVNTNLTLASFIKYPYRHVNSSSIITAENTQFMNHRLSILFSSVTVLWLFILLMRCGDIHPLPGPLSSPTLSSISSISSTSGISLPPL